MLFFLIFKLSFIDFIASEKKYVLICGICVYLLFCILFRFLTKFRRINQKLR
jgi:hypothetical protein